MDYFLPDIGANDSGFFDQPFELSQLDDEPEVRVNHLLQSDPHDAMRVCGFCRHEAIGRAMNAQPRVRIIIRFNESQINSRKNRDRLPTQTLQTGALNRVDTNVRDHACIFFRSPLFSYYFPPFHFCPLNLCLPQKPLAWEGGDDHQAD